MTKQEIQAGLDRWSELMAGAAQFGKYLLLGDLARPGWSGRRRQMAYRALEIAAITIATVIVLIGLAIGFVLLWAASLPAPR